MHFWGLFLEVSKEAQFFIVEPAKNKKDNQAKVTNLKPNFKKTITDTEGGI